MSFKIYATTALVATLFMVFANLFPDQLEGWGVERRWIGEQGLQRQKRAPVGIVQRREEGDGCRVPAFGHSASLFQIFVSGEFKGDANDGNEGAVSGRLAIGGPASLKYWSIGRSIFPQPQSCTFLTNTNIFPYALLSNSSLSLHNTEILNGHIGTSTLKIPKFDPEILSTLKERQCGVQTLESGEFDFDGTKGELEEVSRRLAEMDQTVWVGVERMRPSKIVMKLLKGGGTQVAFVDAGALSQVEIVAVAAKPIRLTPGVTLIINIYGADKVVLKGIDTSILTFPSKVIWNFRDVKEIVFEDLDWYGTILAPWARVEARSTRILGSLYARSFSGVASFRPPVFDGCLPLGNLPSRLLIQRKRRGLEEGRDEVTITETVTKVVTRTQACEVVEASPTLRPGEMGAAGAFGEVHV